MAGDWLFGKKYSRGETFRLIPNAFQVDKFVWQPAIREKKRNELGIVDEIVFIDIARLSEQKNHIYLLRVFEEIKKILPNSFLLLAGAGESEKKIRQYIIEHNLSESVRMLGARSDAAELYQAADMFLFPSKYEGFGTVVIEAQMTNLPVIASDTIPHETKLCDCVEFLPISEEPSKWATKAKEMLDNHIRKDNTLILQNAGFDIRKQYVFIQEFYISKYEQKMR
jgi:glycosyltransferase involved in cell wall biosynthesis